MITDDELAVLIMRACSSRNLFIKHHVMGTFPHVTTLVLSKTVLCLSAPKLCFTVTSAAPDT